MPRNKPARVTALLLTVLTLATAATVLALVWHSVRTEKAAASIRGREVQQRQVDAAARRVHAAWAQREAAVTQLKDLPQREAFAIVVRDGLADSAVFSPGSLSAYPKLIQRLPLRDTMVSYVADALDSQRTKLKSGDFDGAIAIARDLFTAERRDNNSSGRNIALGSDLMLLSALRKAQRDVPAWLTQRMTDDVSNYRGSNIPAPQRRLIMEELADEEAASRFPTYRAECLALTILSEEKNELEVVHLKPSGIQLIFDRAHLQEILSREIGDEGVKVLPPALWPAPEDSTADLHPSLPGWRAVSVASPSPPAGHATALALTGGAATLLLAAITFLTWRHVQRQIRCAQLQEDLAATVSHELRTPVASMRVLAESLLEEQNPPPSKTREYLQLIAGENARLSRLIENFLTLARIERCTPGFSSTAAVPDVIERVTAAANAHAARLQFTGQPPDVHVRIEPASLESALLNLIDNACKYSPPASPVQWSATVAGPTVVFTVRDHGPGLTSGQLSRLWQPFERGDTAQPGCGLGLAIVQRIARQAGGSVSAENVTVGGGCRFQLILPNAETSPA